MIGNDFTTKKSGGIYEISRYTAQQDGRTFKFDFGRNSGNEGTNVTNANEN